MYRNESDASLLDGCSLEAEFAVLPLGAFARSVQYGRVSGFGQDQMSSSCACRVAMLRVPWVLVAQWIRYAIFVILKDRNVDSVLDLLVIARVAESHGKSRPGLYWFPFTFGEGAKFVLLASSPLRQVSASGKQIQEGGMLMRRRL